MPLSIAQITPGNEEEFYRILMDSWANKLRIAIPGIIQSFDAKAQTVTVQPAIRERVQDPKTMEYKWTSLPLLVDVPLVLTRAGGFALTLPVTKGDECLVIFADACIDSWWEKGGVQNQPDKRRHDLSDGYAILAPTSQPKVLQNYSTTSAQLRTEDGSQYIDLSSIGITIKGNVTIDGTLTTHESVVGGIKMSTHVHSDPQGGTTGQPE